MSSEPSGTLLGLKMKNNDKQVNTKDDIRPGDLVYFLGYKGDIEWLGLVLGDIRESRNEVSAKMLILCTSLKEHCALVVPFAMIKGAFCRRLTDV